MSKSQKVFVFPCGKLCVFREGRSFRMFGMLFSHVYFGQAVTAGQDGSSEPKLQRQKTQAFLSLARFSDAQYQSIKNYMRSSEFENKQALLNKAREEVELMKKRNVIDNRSGFI